MNPHSSEALALSGVKVLALEVSVSGPHCTRILGDMGAEVIKIERPKDGDLIRHWASAVRGLSSGYVWLNYNKRSLALDIKKPAGLEILHRLIKSVDIVVENFTPGAAKRLGLGYDDLRAINPRLIYCSISGYGQSGPYMQVKAYDLLIQGEARIIATTCSKDEPALHAGKTLLPVDPGRSRHHRPHGLQRRAGESQRSDSRSRLLDVRGHR